MNLNQEGKAKIIISEILNRNGKNFSWLAKKLEVTSQSISINLAKDRKGLKLPTLVKYVQAVNPGLSVEVKFITEKTFFLYVRNAQSVIVHSIKYT